VIAAGEAGHVGHVADDGAGDDRADAEHLGESRSGSPDRSGELVAGAAQLGIEAAHVLEELGGELGAGQRYRAGRRDLLQDRRGLACGDLLVVAAGDQVAEHGVEPAGDLVAGPGQVPVPLGPHLQHHRVVIGGHLPDSPGAQRRDRHRQGVVRVVLVRVASLQRPHPGHQLRLHVQHPLARRDQLLGQQPA
jgi:hypothetical protein